MKQWPIAGHDIPYVNIIDELPISATWSGISSVVVQYESDATYDGHFVITSNTDALAQWPHWIETMIDTGVGELIAP